MKHWAVPIIDCVAGACCAAACVLLLLSAAPHIVGAQSAEVGWEEPANISRSGAASSPVLVADPEGNPQAFWWDRLSGMMTSVWDGGKWGDPVPSQVYMQGATSQSLPRPLSSIPDVTYDVRGWAHAWWQVGVADAEGPQLWHSRLVIGASGWFRPSKIADSALAYDVVHDPTGGLHLAYIRSLHTSVEPAGVYYRYSSDSGNSWSDPVMLSDSIYFRLLSREDAYIRVFSDGQGHTLAIWDDPRRRKSFMARATDEGWSAPQEQKEIPWSPRGIRFAGLPDGDIALLWPSAQGTECSLQYFLSSDGGQTWSAHQSAPRSVDTCRGQVALMLVNGSLLAVSGLGSDSLTLSLWDQKLWLEGNPQTFSFTHPELGYKISLGELQIVLAGDVPIVAGTGSAGDVWGFFGKGPIQDLARVSPPIWSRPAAISGEQRPLGPIAMDSDDQGHVHALWVGEHEDSGIALYYTNWDGTRDLSQDGSSSAPPSAAVQSPGRYAAQPVMIAVGDQLYVFWDDGRNGEVVYTQANVPGTRQPAEWREIMVLPSPSAVGASPAIAVDPYGALHVAYVAPINERRGVYYVRSDDMGQTWSDPDLIFDAEEAGWVTLGNPSIEVDEWGTRHVAWVRTSLVGNLAPLGIYYSRLVAGDDNWSEAVRVAQEGFGAPIIVSTMTGQTHIIWQEAAQSNRCWHQWSTDGGENWTAPRAISGMERVAGRLAVESDGSGALHLVAVARPQPTSLALRHMLWDGGRWRPTETQALEGIDQVGSQVVVALQAKEGRLHVGFVGSQDPDGSLLDFWVSSRSLPSVEVTPFPTLTPLPTATTPALPTATPTLSPNLPVAQELSSGGLTDLPTPLILGIVLAALLAVAAIFIRSVLARR